MGDEELQAALTMLPKTFKRREQDNVLAICRDKIYELVKSPQIGDVVIDAGAYVGVFTGKASLQVGDSGKVYAFEPEPENFSCLRENTKGLKNVEIFQKALWSAEKDLTLFVRRDHPSGHSLIDWVDASYIKERLLVRTTYLDKAVKGKVDFVKIDAEGAELEILRGATCILKKYKPFIAVEVHSKELFHQISCFLPTYGYKHNLGLGSVGVHTFM